jgi:hypothetical protein
VSFTVLPSCVYLPPCVFHPLCQCGVFFPQWVFLSVSWWVSPFFSTMTAKEHQKSRPDRITINLTDAFEQLRSKRRSTIRRRTVPFTLDKKFLNLVCRNWQKQCKITTTWLRSRPKRVYKRTCRFRDLLEKYSANFLGLYCHGLTSTILHRG